MDAKIVGGLLGLVGSVHLLIASLATIELKDYPLFSFKQKIFWFLVIWLLPFIGAYWFHKKINVKIKGGASTTGDCTTGGYCGGGDGGSCGD